MNALARCLDRMWAAALEPAGVDYESPGEVRLVGTPEEAACGTGDLDWAGIYCGEGRVVNVLVEDGPERREVFPMMFTLAHEYAHHVQTLVGISGRDGSEVFDEAWSRRLELQADCLAAAALRDVRPYLLNDLRRAVADGEETGATEEAASALRASHGSPRNGARWMLRGQKTGAVGDCNTWKAPEREVS
nr:neutral zinc metallopeptidase [Planomonospora venezuelensis]